MSSSTQTSHFVTQSRALVLGGGGPVGRAWQTGLAAGLSNLGVDFRNAHLIVGTSAGAIVGAEIALGRDMNDAVPASTSSAAPAPRTRPEDVVLLMAAMARAAASATPETELKKIGQMALSADVPSEESALHRPNLGAVAGQAWPSNFEATAVNTRSGRLQVWSASSCVSLQKALAASSALPGVWPPITIGADRYMDGGVRSTLNADLAKGRSRVVVVSCRSLEIASDTDPVASTIRAQWAQIAMLRESGSTVEIITPDANFRALTSNGVSLLNTALEPEAYDMGKLQAESEIARIRTVWNE
jgi:NTE family protein